MGTRSTRRFQARSFVMASALAVLGAVACQPIYGRPGPFDPHAITDFGTDGYGYGFAADDDGTGHPATTSWDDHDVAQGTLVVSDRSASSSGNSRQVAPVIGAVDSQDQGSCVTILGPLGGYIQPGVALRIRTDGGRTRAVTVTNNIVYGARFGFNVHLADSAAAGADQMREVTGYIPSGFATTVDNLPPPPWRLCARVNGQLLRVKVWAPNRTAEPTYADPRFGLSTTLPADWVFPGKPGFYVGHLGNGELTWLAIEGLEQTPG